MTCGCSPYQRRVLPLTHRSHHSGQVGLPLLLVLILRVPDQIGVDRLALAVALQPVQLAREKTKRAPVSTSLSVLNRIQVKALQDFNAGAACEQYSAVPLAHRAPSACLSVQEHLQWSSGHSPLCSDDTRSTPSRTQPR